MVPTPRSLAFALSGCLTLLTACSGAGSSAHPPASPYLGQPPPGEKPVPFAPGLVNTDAVELNSVFTPDGREFFFTRSVGGVLTIFHSELGESGWSAPRPLILHPDGDQEMAVDMAVSPDGNELYFLGDDPDERPSGEPGLDLWVSRRVDGRWAQASLVPPPVRTPSEEIYATVVADGSLYFSSNRPGAAGGRNDLYRAQRISADGFAEPVRVGAPISSTAGVGDTFVASDETYMVFASRRSPRLGRGDLFVSFRLPDESWSEPLSLGAPINTAEHEYCPMMSPDGAYLFFSRRYGDTWETTTGGDVFWVDARVLEPLRRIASDRFASASTGPAAAR